MTKALEQCLEQHPGNSIRFIAEYMQKSKSSLATCINSSTIDQHVHDKETIYAQVNKATTYEISLLKANSQSNVVRELPGVPIYKMTNPSLYEVEQMLEHIHGMLSIQCKQRNVIPNSEPNCNDKSSIVIILELTPQEQFMLYIRDLLYSVKIHEEKSCNKAESKGNDDAEGSNDTEICEQKSNEHLSAEHVKYRGESSPHHHTYTYAAIFENLRSVFDNENVKTVQESIIHKVETIFGSQLIKECSHMEQKLDNHREHCKAEFDVHVLVLPEPQNSYCHTFDLLDCAFTCMCTHFSREVGSELNVVDFNYEHQQRSLSSDYAATEKQIRLPYVLFISFDEERSSLTLSRILASYLP